MAHPVMARQEQLFLFEVLSFLINQKKAGPDFIRAFKCECVSMTFIFAKKYYDPVFEASLMQAAHCVLGILNLGLLECSGGSLQTAASCLIQKPGLHVFREGWTRIMELAEHENIFESQDHKTRFEREKDFAERFSAEPGKKWTGHTDYLIHRLYFEKKKGMGDELF